MKRNRSSVEDYLADDATLHVQEPDDGGMTDTDLPPPWDTPMTWTGIAAGTGGSVPSGFEGTDGEEAQWQIDSSPDHLAMRVRFRDRVGTADGTEEVIVDGFVRQPHAGPLSGFFSVTVDDGPCWVDGPYRTLAANGQPRDVAAAWAEQYRADAAQVAARTAESRQAWHRAVAYARRA